MGQRGTRIVLSLLLALAAAGGTAGAAADPPGAPGGAAVQTPEGTAAHAGRWIVDAEGRVVVVHGVNMPAKLPPGHALALRFDDDDAAVLAEAGFNAVRLTVERYIVAPAPGVFDDTSIDALVETIRVLDRHGILTLVDFHQDQYGPVFFDNGYPEWMTMTDGLPNLYQVGFPAQYLVNPALNRAFDHLWANDVGPSGRPLQEDDAAILAHVAERIAGEPGLLGYEIINEPWPGTVYPTCVVPVIGCPLFDRGPLSTYYERTIAALRDVDPVHLIWYEPLSTFNQGAPTAVVPPSDPALGFAFHVYSLCGLLDDLDAPVPLGSACVPENEIVLANAESHAEASRNALFATEFGATMDTAVLTDQLRQFDDHRMSWMFWSYTRYLVALEGDGGLAPATAPNLNDAMLDTLVRPYPQLVSGTPTSWSFDPATDVFTLRYSPARADGAGAFPAGSETAVAVPARQYPGGYQVTVTGAIVTSAANAPVLRLQSEPGSGPITVTVAPAGAPPSPGEPCPRLVRGLPHGSVLCRLGRP